MDNKKEKVKEYYEFLGYENIDDFLINTENFVIKNIKQVFLSKYESVEALKKAFLEQCEKNATITYPDSFLKIYFSSIFLEKIIMKINRAREVNDKNLKKEIEELEKIKLKLKKMQRKG